MKADMSRSAYPFDLIDCAEVISTPPADPRDNPPVHAPAKVQAKHHLRSGRRLLVQTAGIADANLGDECAGFLPFVPNQRLVIVEVGEHRVHLGERSMRMRPHYCICQHTQMLELVGNLADFDVGSTNHRTVTGVVLELRDACLKKAPARLPRRFPT